MPPDWTRLAGLAGDDFQLALLTEADAVMDGQPDPEKTACCQHCQSRCARLTVGVLRRIGANRMADIVAEAIADHLARLIRQYWQTAADDDWGSKLDIYLREQVRLLTE